MPIKVRNCIPPLEVGFWGIATSSEERNANNEKDLIALLAETPGPNRVEIVEGWGGGGASL